MRFRILIIVSYVILLCVSNTSAKTPTPRVRVLCDFENQSSLSHWNVRDSEGVESKARVSISDSWSSQGKKSGFFQFKQYEKGDAEWQVVEFKMSNTPLEDWRGWDFFEIDVFNPSIELVKVRITVNYGSKRVYVVWEVDPGSRRFRIPVRFPLTPGVDISKLTSITVVMKQAEHDSKIYLDNLRLIDNSPVLLQELSESLEFAVKKFGDQNSEYSVFYKQCKTIGSMLSHEEDPGKRDELCRQLEEISTQTRGMLIQSSKDSIIRLAKIIPPAVDSGDPSLDKTVEPGRYFELNNSVDYEQLIEFENLRSVVESGRELLAQQRLKMDIERQFPESDFAVGTPLFPMTLTKTPKTYSGQLGTDVHIYAARREYEPFQLVIIPKDKPLNDVYLNVSDMIGPSVIESGNIEISPMGWRKHPLDGEIRADMLRTDIKKFDVPADVQQPVWINVFVPEDAQPGDYKGTIEITSGDSKTQRINLTLTVWPFTLPKYPSMRTASADWGESRPSVEKSVKLLISHRLSPTNLYQKPPLITPESFKKWNQLGSDNYNILRIDRMGFGSSDNGEMFVRDDNGRLKFSKRRKQFFTNSLDSWIEQAKAVDFDYLKHCYLYGFDEIGSDMVPVMEDMYGECKQRYGDICTAAAFNSPVWNDYPDIKNLDRWIIIARLLTRELRDELHSKGHEVWWYNLYADNRNPVGCRVQFWATFKDRLDGVLHWSLAAGGGWEPYGDELDCSGGRPDDVNRSFFWGGLIRRNNQDMPISTVALECWREGLEDCDYLTILRNLYNQLKENPNSETEYKYLLSQAEKMINVPDNITVGIIDGQQLERSEVTLGFTDSTDSMDRLLLARKKTAELIIQIQEILSEHI